MSFNRRHFLKRSLAAGGAVSLPLFVSSRAFGANDEIRVGIVGLGVRGAGEHLPRWQKQKGVRVAAICDPDRERLGKCGAHVEKTYGHKPAEHVDVRNLVALKELDAVSIATMQYWHALGTVWACQAGKHVYCEKPLSHFIWEGQQMVKAARKYGRLVQVGTQRRSQKSVIDSINYVRAGKLGKIKFITAFANKPRTSIGKRTEPLPIPETLDYDLWCGPARKEPVYRNKLQYDCSFTWNMGDGESCNQGVHEIDMARWCLGEAGLPRRTMSIGGRFTFNDAGDVPNTQIIYYDFPTAPILYEVHNLTAGKGSKEVPTFRGVRTGICVECEGGFANIPDGNIFDPQGKKIASFGGGETHFENFIAAVRSGRREDLHADVAVGHVSTAITHVGNISYRLGKPATNSEMRAAVKDTPLFAEMYGRLLEHLKAHEIDADAKTVTLGPWLDIDREKECFKDNAEANRLVRGFYRSPYLLPELDA